MKTPPINSPPCAGLVGSNRRVAYRIEQDNQMGMYDDVSFSYRMPNGRDGYNFQTKDLECRLDEYEVTPSGRLVRIVSDDEIERPLGDLNHHGWLDIRDAFDYYRLDFVNGSLRAIQVIGEEGWLLFDPANCIET